MQEWLKGKKTYIVAGAGIIIAAANVILKIVNDEPVTTEDVAIILGFLGLGTTRSGIKKIEK